MKVRILLASIMLLNASLSPCIALAETVTNNNQQTETTSSSITEEKTTNVISPTTISTTNEEIPPPSTDTPTIIGTPQLIGESYKDGVSKPKRINLSATETMQQTFIEDEENKKTTHSYIGGNIIYEINSTDVQVPNPRTTDSSTIQLAVYTGDVSQTKQTLAYYLAQQFKTYQLSLENLTDILSIDPTLAINEDSLFALIKEYYPQVTEKTTIREIEDLTDQYGSVQQQSLTDTFNQQSNEKVFSGNILLSRKIVLSNQETFFFVESDTQSGWIFAENLTYHASKIINLSEKGKLTGNHAKIYSTLDDAWLEKSAMQADLETLYEINQQIQINNRSFYKISHDNVVVGYVDQNDFNKLGQGDPDTTETENITPTIPSNSSVNDTNHSPSERRTETSISYSTHVRGHGWMPTSKNGELSGTEGQGLRIEAIRANLTSSLSGSIEYSSYVEGTGWQDWVSNGAISGTEGQGLQIEGINMRLTGELAENYNLYYRVHVQKLGWLPWAKNGNPSGTSSFGFRIEAIEIQLISRSQQGPELGDSYVQRASINYSTHVRGQGWLPESSNGEISGTEGQGLRIEALRVNLSSAFSGSIEYTSYIENHGWQNWVANGGISGTEGQGRQIEGIRIRLTDELATHYNIYYRIHAQNLGWLPWAENGNSAGTLGYGYRIEAIEIRLLPKEQIGPPTGESYVEKTPSVLANAHVASRGWLPEQTAETQVGTVGQGLSLQALQLKLTENSYEGGIVYQSHLAHRGWETSWIQEGQTSGTVGQSLALQAVRINLTGDISHHYDIYYRVHSQHFGWLDWAKNGESAGTQGYSYRAESLQIKLVEKGQAPPGQTARAFRIAPPKVSFDGHVSGIGWVNRNGLSNSINHANQGRQFEAIRAQLEQSDYSGGIRYDSHISTSGWTNPVENGAISGSVGHSRALQAFSFQLTGELSEKYDIYYRSFVRSRGWLGWASNGQKAGSVGMSLPVEAIEVTIVENDRKPAGYQANQLTILGQIDTSTPEGRFVNSITQSANRVAPAYGLYTSVMLAQAILETGYGTSFLARNANNFFGMKFKDGEDEGKYDYVWHVSNEVVNGITIPVNSKFRVYQSTDESFIDNAVKLKYGVPWDPVRYRGTWKVNTRSYRDATQALTGTYATDPNYGTKLNNIIERWRLDQFD